MSKLSLLSQIGMIGIAVIIFVMYIQPTVSEIKNTQDLVASYDQATFDVSQVNIDLANKITQINNVPSQDIKALDVFLPEYIDELSILKDISTILEASSISGYELEYSGIKAGIDQDGQPVDYQKNMTIAHGFKIKFNGNYSQLKSMLALLESNNYLLQVSELNVESAESSLTVDMLVLAYSKSAPESDLTEI